jgi:branched-chain amino acid transport system permease protein
MGYVWELGALCAIYVIAAVSLNLLQGTMGVMTIAQAGFLAIGGYSTAILTTRHITTFVPSIFVGVGISAVVAVLLAWPVLSLSGFIYTIASFAVMLTVTSLSTSWTSLTNGSYGIPDIPPLSAGGVTLNSTASSAVTYLVLAVLITLGFARITRSHWGIAMRGMRESVAAARSLGKPVVGITFGGYVLSAAAASLAGSLYAAFTGYLDPTVFTVTTAFLLVAMVVIGGRGNVWAVAAGSLVISLLPNLLPLVTPLSASIVGPATQVLYGVILVACLLLRPLGLVPERSLRVGPNVLQGSLSAPRSSSGRVRLLGGATAFRARDSVGQPDAAQVPAADADRASESGAAPARHAVAAGKQSAAAPTLVAASDATMPALKVMSLSKQFGGVRALSDVSFTLETSVITGLLGANGAGKSTLLGIISGFIEPNAGSIELFGRDITHVSATARARAGVVRTFQELRLFEGLTTLENVIVGVPGVGRIRTGLGLPRSVLQTAADLLEQLDLMRLANTRVRAISYGDRKLIAVARALATGARLLLVDEPFSGLTDREIERLCVIFRSTVSSGATLLLIDHNAQAVTSFVDHLLVMDHGSLIAEGSPEKVTSDPAVIEAYFGRQVEEADG